MPLVLLIAGTVAHPLTGTANNNLQF